MRDRDTVCVCERDWVPRERLGTDLVTQTTLMNFNDLNANVGFVCRIIRVLVVDIGQLQSQSFALFAVNHNRSSARGYPHVCPWRGIHTRRRTRHGQTRSCASQSACGCVCVWGCGCGCGCGWSWRGTRLSHGETKAEESMMRRETKLEGHD